MLSLKLSDLKPRHVRCIVETYSHLKRQSDSIIKGFNAAGISKAITCENDVFKRVEKTSNEQSNNRIFSSFFAFLS